MWKGHISSYNCIREMEEKIEKKKQEEKENRMKEHKIRREQKAKQEAAKKTKVKHSVLFRRSCTSSSNILQ